MTIRPPGRVTRTSSFAASSGLGANIAPKMLTTRSKLSSSSSLRSDASPSWNLQLVRPRLCARAFPASTRLLAMSTPRTFAPSLAAGKAVVPSPQPRSRTSSPSVIPNVVTSASQHLHVLAWAGLVRSRREGTRIFYRLASERVGDLWAAVRDVAVRHVAEVNQLADEYLGERDGVEHVSAAELQARLVRGDVV